MVTLIIQPSKLSRSVYLSCMVWRSVWLGNLLSVYANSWTGLISIRRSRKTNNRGRGRLRLTLKRWGTSGRIGTTIIGLGKIILGNWGPLILWWLTRCSENQCTRFWRRLRMSHSLSGQVRWEETPWGTIRAFIVNNTKTEDIPQRL